MHFMNINDIFIDLEVYRNPFEMKKYFESIYEITYQNEKLKELARMKRGLYKQFLEEFYPLYLFSQSSYCDEHSRMKIIVGNQNYDAVFINPDGSEEKFEFTSYIDGEWEFQDAKRLNERGYGDIKVHDSIDLANRDQEYLSKIIGNVVKKSKKDYSHANIIFIVDTYYHFEIYNRDPSEFIKMLKEEIPRVNIKALRIFLLIKNNHKAFDIDKNLYLLKGAD